MTVGLGFSAMQHHAKPFSEHCRWSGQEMIMPKIEAEVDGLGMGCSDCQQRRRAMKQIIKC